MSESPKPADALRTLPERAFRARARLVAGVFCLVCCGLAVRLFILMLRDPGSYALRAADIAAEKPRAGPGWKPYPARCTWE